MRHVTRTAFPFLLVLGAYLAIGCSEESTGPDNQVPFSPGKYLWSKRFGDMNDQCAQALAVDASRNVIVTGYFNDIVDFGGGALTSAGYDDIFLAKFGADGHHLWSKRFGDTEQQRAYAAAADASGNVIIAGSFEGTVDFGGGALTCIGWSDIFVAKFGVDGSHLWSKRFGGVYGASQAVSVAIDASGNVIVTGNFTATVDFGGGVLASAGDRDIFLAKFGPDGSHLWSTRLGDADYQDAVSVAIDASGNVIIAGRYHHSVEFGPGYPDVFIAKFGADGGQLWSKHFLYGAAKAVAVDAFGNVIVAGFTFSTVDFGGGVLTSAGSDDIFLAKFGADGGHLWSKRFGDENSQNVISTAIDASGNVIITGYFGGTVDFGGGGVLTSAGELDIYIAKFGADGRHLWSKRFGDTWNQVAIFAGLDAAGSVVVAGYFLSTIDFGGGVLASAGGSDIFVAKFGP